VVLGFVVTEGAVAKGIAIVLWIILSLWFADWGPADSWLIVWVVVIGHIIAAGFFMTMQNNFTKVIEIRKMTPMFKPKDLTTQPILRRKCIICEEEH
jgi:hypothetical protein